MKQYRGTLLVQRLKLLGIFLVGLAVMVFSVWAIATYEQRESIMRSCVAEAVSYTHLTLPTKRIV